MVFPAPAGMNRPTQRSSKACSSVPRASGDEPLYGRPITLSSNGGAWFTLATVRLLEALRDQLGIVMLLTLPTGAQHYVTWNRAAGAPVQATPLFRTVNPGPDWLYELTLRLITVPPPPPAPGP